VQCAFLFRLVVSTVEWKMLVRFNTSHVRLRLLTNLVGFPSARNHAFISASSLQPRRDLFVYCAGRESERVPPSGGFSHFALEPWRDLFLYTALESRAGMLRQRGGKVLLAM
jgi:hypothetical protein